MKKNTKKQALEATVGKSGYLAPKPEKGAFKGRRVALVATRWNVEIVDALLAGARACAKDWGVTAKNVDEFRAPGAFELPLAVAGLIDSGKYDAIVVLGAVIRGDTPHFEYVAGECSRGLRELSQKHRMPLGFGVLTVNTVEQALERCVPGVTNKGYEAAAAALEMVTLLGAIND